MNLSGLDLNLLWVLHVLLEERSVKAAAARLHLTPPAVSNALARLRSALDDPLFVRSGRGLVPTRRATEIAPALDHAMKALAGSLATTFDPKTCTKTLTLALSDAEMLTVLPALTPSVRQRLPRAHLRIVTLDTLTAGGGLAADGVDATIGPEEAAGKGVHHHFLFEDTGCLVARRGHPRLRGRISAKQFAAEHHVDIHLLLGAPGSGHRTTRDAIDAAGFHRTIAATVPTFLAAATVIANSDLVGGLPRRVVDRLREPLGLQVLRTTAALPRFRMALLWHERTDADPAARQLRAAVLESLG
jgi:DNA-binding transcriptional LysR family regulator